MKNKANYSFVDRMKAIHKGFSLTRILMHEGISVFTIKGKVADIGAGNVRHEYHDYLQHENTALELIDGRTNPIDFEKDQLPFTDESFDTVLSCNVLEHIYNHRFLIAEMKQILKEGGTLIGFVPFLVKYHPDPYDYLRYTKEALRRLFEDAGFSDIKVTAVGGGPFFANFSNIMQSLPIIVRLLLYPLYAFTDALFLKLRPHAKDKFPLRYVFSAKN
jgi:SAM-dependent methyltransferase